MSDPILESRSDVSDSFIPSEVFVSEGSLLPSEAPTFLPSEVAPFIPSEVEGGLVSAAIERLPGYHAGRSIEEVTREFGLTHVIKLASNENPFGPSPMAVKAMARALTSVNRYPDEGADELRGDIAERWAVRPSQVIFGAGCTDLIQLIIQTFTTPADVAVISEGSFAAYRLFLMAASTPFVEVPLRDDAIDLDAMAKTIRRHSGSKLVFLPNPNNPTGTRFTKAELNRFLEAIPSQVLVVLDDAYLDFCGPRDDMPDTLEVLRARPRTIVLRGFSKAYGLAGLRLGYGLASEELIGYLHKVRRPFSVTRLAMEAGRAALRDDAHLRKTVKKTVKAREELYRALSGLGFRAVKSYANFVMIDLGSASAAQMLAGELLASGLIVRSLGAFGVPTGVRFTVGNADENQALVSALAKIKATGVLKSHSREN